MKKVWVQIDPEAQKVVPVEPTKEMLWAITPASALLSEWKQNYASMLSAAPTVPHLEGEDEAVGVLTIGSQEHGPVNFLISPRAFDLLPDGSHSLYTRPQPIGEIEDWRKEAGRDVSEFAGKVKAEIEAQALEEVADKILRYNYEPVGYLRQLAAQKRAAAGEGK